MGRPSKWERHNIRYPNTQGWGGVGWFFYDFQFVDVIFHDFSYDSFVFKLIEALTYALLWKSKSSPTIIKSSRRASAVEDSCLTIDPLSTHT